MNELSTERFSGFFHELYGREPYSWQRRLVARAVEGAWPRAIDLPTASGKTACIDIAIYALACQAGRPVADRKGPRRIFFCVNRRIIVDEAYDRARQIAERLWIAERDPASSSPTLVKVAAALRRLGGTAIGDDVPPLDVLELRGGVYRDNRWARSAAQPIVVCTTIDQLGSRLLFRGYGVSPNAAPIQAALIAYDSLVLLDEAHISKPFLQTLTAVGGYLDPTRWAQEPIAARPIVVVPMTATPAHSSEPTDVIGLDDDDRKNDALNRRLTAAKRAILQPAAKVADAVVGLAEKQAEPGAAAIGVIVNRVATAKEIYKVLRREFPAEPVELCVGPMRPLDRDVQSTRLAPRVGKDRPEVTSTTSFVVATQCLEVGADYDFDVLITECASLDALRQRFGRLNRGGRAIQARAFVVMESKAIRSDDALDSAKPVDPIYGNAATRTWNWLWEHAEVSSTDANPDASETSGSRKKAAAKLPSESRSVDFGVDAFNSLLERYGDTGRIPDGLLAPSASVNAPVLLPAHVDFWCQTSPRPAPDPDIALFIHGPQRDEPDVQVCWRADLIEREFVNRDDWCDVVALLPPTAAECVTVPLSRVRRWLTAPREDAGDQSDLLELAASTADEANGSARTPEVTRLQEYGVLWRGANESVLLHSPGDLRPGDTLVLPASRKGWEDLGHVPEVYPEDQSPTDVIADTDVAAAEGAPNHDIGEEAFRALRDRYALRLHPSRLAPYRKSQALQALLKRVHDFDDRGTYDELRLLMREAAAEVPAGDRSIRDALAYFGDESNPFIRASYPDGLGVVLLGRKRVDAGKRALLPPLDEGDDETSRTNRDSPVALDHHTRHVAEKLRDSLGLLPTGVSEAAYRVAAERHDWGKIDDRFQALLRGADRTDAWLFAGSAPRLLAKSDGVPRTPHERREARVRSGLPDGFRHEMLSVQLAERAEPPAGGPGERDLILHLIASHHGYARPFAPVTRDDQPPDVSYRGMQLSSHERRALPPQRLDSAIADRFWSLVRRYGWWGVAYLESLLRLADQQASAAEDAGDYRDEHEPRPAEVTE